MASVEMMRDAISKVYGPFATKWIRRCHSMSDEQVMAIYFRFKKDGKFDRRRKHVKTLQKKNEEYHQITLWECGLHI